MLEKMWIYISSSEEITLSTWWFWYFEHNTTRLIKIAKQR